MLTRHGIFHFNYSVIGFFSDILILTFKEGWQIGSVLDFYVEIEEKYSNVTKKTETPFKSKNMKYEKRASCLKYAAFGFLKYKNQNFKLFIIYILYL